MSSFYLGQFVCGLGALLFFIGTVYWVLFAWQPTVRQCRSSHPVHLLGNLTVVGLLIFAIGQMLAIDALPTP